MVHISVYDNLNVRTYVYIYRMVRISSTVLSTNHRIATTRLPLQYTFIFDIHKDKALHYFSTLNLVSHHYSKPGPHPVRSPVYSFCVLYTSTIDSCIVHAFTYVVVGYSSRASNTCFLSDDGLPDLTFQDSSNS